MQKHVKFGRSVHAINSQPTHSNVYRPHLSCTVTLYSCGAAVGYYVWNIERNLYTQMQPTHAERQQEVGVEDIAE